MRHKKFFWVLFRRSTFNQIVRAQHLGALILSQLLHSQQAQETDRSQATLYPISTINHLNWWEQILVEDFSMWPVIQFPTTTPRWLVECRSLSDSSVQKPRKQCNMWLKRVVTYWSGGLKVKAERSICFRAAGFCHDDVIVSGSVTDGNVSIEYNV